MRYSIRDLCWAVAWLLAMLWGTLAEIKYKRLTDRIDKVTHGGPSCVTCGRPFPNPLQ